MSKESRIALSNQRLAREQAERAKAAHQNRFVESLLDAMEDGREYVSIVDKTPREDTNVLEEVVRGIAEIEKIRNRPCILYVGNVITKDGGEAGVDSTDDLPFQEMVGNIPLAQRSVDVYLATNGGSGSQVSRFVNCLRARFDEVHFLIPSFCMSAGTLFALSGEHIWMTKHACLGPIDPQVPSAGGRYVPAQALLLLVDEIQKQGDEAMAKALPIPWAAVRLIDSLDKKELGDAITASRWSQNLAAQYLEQYKFKNWAVRKSSEQPVTSQYRTQRANEVAAAMVSHDRWKSHGHAISREVLWSEIKLHIDHPDADMERAMVRLWALLTWLFDKTNIQKIMCSKNYRYVRQQVIQIIGQR